LCGIAVSRFHVTPTQFYWEFTPVELHHAFRDFETNRDRNLHLICETIRNVAVVIFNTAYGRKSKNVIKDPRDLWMFRWEKYKKTEIQSLSEMKGMLSGIALNHNLNIHKRNGGKNAG
jgi:hypothetical protein